MIKFNIMEMLTGDKGPALPQKIEEQANFEGNETILFLKRIQNPTIKGQVVNLLLRVFEEETGIAPWQQPAKRSEIEEELNERIRKASSHTNINFDPGRPPDEGSMPINWTYSSGEKATDKQKSITEAHEKGHTIRNYDTLRSLEFLYSYFSKGFDISKVEHPEEVFEGVKIPEESKHFINKESIKQGLNDYLFSPHEIIERMSQLKNYFGMEGSEKFTKEHLQYARDNYTKDTGMNNLMSQFFQAITSDTEDIFLDIINKAGV